MSGSNPNPYALPNSEAATAAGKARATDYVYRPTHLLTPMLRVSYAVQIALLAIVAPLSIFAASALEDDASDAAELTGPQFTLMLSLAAVAMLYAGALIMTIVLHCVWTIRSNKNARALGAKGMEFSPGWAAGWYFVPIANLGTPLFAASEFYLASDPGPNGVEWQQRKMPAVLKAWWACWIIGTILSRVANRAPLEPAAASVLGEVSLIIWMIAAAIAFYWIGVVYRRQEKTAAERRESSLLAAFESDSPH